MRQPTLVAPNLLGALVVFAVTAGPAIVAGPAAIAGPEPATGSPAPHPVPGPEEAERVPVGDVQEFPTVPYDGTYTFVRVRFNTGHPGFGVFGRSRGPPWAHDYPFADENFVRILDEVTLLGPNTEGTNVIDADDPVLHRHPIAYVSEPGYWVPTRAEVDNVSAFLRKGGFLILDDFRGSREWSNVEAIFNVVLPGHRFRVLDIEEPIFDSFFRIETLDIPPPTFPQYEPVFLGIHEDDDPERRLMVVANFNNDIGDYWEYSDLGYFPIDLSNEAYKFGVNYVIYAMNR
ncbi:MAG: DUF4159 domain-containing protein [Gemmatimonadota bacterium]|nr:DUF4159 domain-containing protein [Gemmatimonadota bacterium]MDE2872405.1 DUF4159 domain-containing protein [Gemmatimonadota bacterium]